MGGVDVAEDVGLQSRVHGDKAQTAHNFRVVGDFAGAHDDFVAEVVNLLHEAEHGLVGEGQCAGRCEFALALFHECEHCVLDYLGVHLKLRHFGVLAQSEQHSVGHVAHARLDGKELLGDAAAAEVVNQEVADVVAYALGDFVGRREGLDALGGVRRHYAHNLCRIDFQNR